MRWRGRARQRLHPGDAPRYTAAAHRLTRISISPAPMRPLAACLVLAAATPGIAAAQGTLRLPLPTPAPPAADTAAVVAAAQRLFDGMIARDSTALLAALHPDAVVVSVGADGRARVTPGRTWARGIAAAPDPLVERMDAPRVEIAGDLATLWTAYDFHIGARFSHCGTDAFQFARTDGAWRLLVVTFTRQMTGCAAP